MTPDEITPSSDTPLTKEQIHKFKVYTNLKHHPIIIVEEIQVPDFINRYHLCPRESCIDLLKEETWSEKTHAYLCWNIIKFRYEIIRIGDIYDFIDPSLRGYDHGTYLSLSKKKRKKMKEKIWPTRKSANPIIINRLIAYKDRVLVVK